MAEIPTIPASFPTDDLLRYGAVALGAVLNAVVGVANYRRYRALKEEQRKAAQIDRTECERREDWREYRRDTALKIQAIDDDVENVKIAIPVLGAQVEELEKRRKEQCALLEELFNEKNATNKRLDRLEAKFERVENEHYDITRRGKHE